MTRYYIRTVARWETVAGQSLGNGDVIELNADLTFTSQPSVITISTGVIFDGRNHQISLNITGDINGLFSLTGGTIRNLHIDGGAGTLDISNGALVTYSSDDDSVYGTVTNCSIDDITGGINSGCLLPNNFGNSGMESVVSRCSAMNVTIHGGGICGASTDNVEFNDCFCKDTTFSSGRAYLGGICKSVVGSCTFNDCYSEGTFSTNGAYNAGILGLAITSGITVTMNRCYFIGTIQTNYQSGLIGRIENAIVNITDCYTSVVMNSVTYAGGMIGLSESNTLNFTNCYTTNSTNGGYVGLDGSSDTVATFTNTYMNSVNYFNLKDNDLTINSTNGNSTLTGITGVIDDNWSSSVWSSTDTYPILDGFTDTDIWDGSYEDYNDTPIFSNASLAVMNSTKCLLGDTLIMTRNGYVRIDQLSAGVKVVCADGRYARVKDVQEIGGYDDELYVIKAHSIMTNVPFKDIHLTHNHKIFVPSIGWIKPKKFAQDTRYMASEPVNLFHIVLNCGWRGILANGAVVESCKL